MVELIFIKNVFVGRDSTHLKRLSCLFIFTFSSKNKKSLRNAIIQYSCTDFQLFLSKNFLAKLGFHGLELRVSGIKLSTRFMVRYLP